MLNWLEKTFYNIISLKHWQTLQKLLLERWRVTLLFLRKAISGSRVFLVSHNIYMLVVCIMNL